MRSVLHSDIMHSNINRSRIGTLSWSRNGRQLLTAADKTVIGWDVASGETVRTMVARFQNAQHAFIKLTYWLHRTTHHLMFLRNGCTSAIPSLSCFLHAYLLARTRSHAFSVGPSRTLSARMQLFREKFPSEITELYHRYNGTDRMHQAVVFFVLGGPLLVDLVNRQGDNIAGAVPSAAERAATRAGGA